MRTPISILVSILACGAVLAACRTEIPSPCPREARFETSASGVAACVFEGIHLPDTQALAPDCSELAQGRFGFTWEPNPWTYGYRCPPGWKSDSGPGGQPACSVEGVRLDRVKGYDLTCAASEVGHMSFTWRRATAAISVTGEAASRLVKMGSRAVLTSP